MNLIKRTNVEYITEPHITYTHCYDQYGLFTMNFNRTTEQNFLKICGGKFNFEYLYIE